MRARLYRILAARMARAQIRLADFDMARRDMLMRQADEALASAEKRIAIVRDLAARCGLDAA